MEANWTHDRSAASYELRMLRKKLEEIGIISDDGQWHTPVESRTAQDADNALLVRALWKAKANFTSIHQHGRCLFVCRTPGLAGTQEGTMFTDLAPDASGNMVIDSDIRAALRRALGEE